MIFFITFFTQGLLISCNQMSAEYLFMTDKLYDVRYDTGDKVIQCGRHNDIFKLWLQWRAKVRKIMRPCVRREYNRGSPEACSTLEKLPLPQLEIFNFSRLVFCKSTSLFSLDMGFLYFSLRKVAENIKKLYYSFRETTQRILKKLIRFLLF